MSTAAAPTISSRSFMLLLGAAILFNYVDRGTVGVAAPLMKEELALSATTFGIVVSAFFWVYAPVQLVVGWLCDRFCVYRLLAGGMALCAASTVFTGLVGGVYSLIVLRLLLGLGESIAFPGSSKIIARHVPPSQRGLANSSVSAGLALGPAIGTFAGGLIMASHGWRAMFVTFGLLTLVWLAPWFLTTRPLIRQSGKIREMPFPVSRLIANRALWAMSIGHFIANYMLYFVLTWLPLYLVKSRGYSITEMTLMASLVYIFQAGSALVSGWVSDNLVARGRDEGAVRRLLLTVGSAGLAGSIAGIAFASAQPELVACLIAAGIFQGLKGANIFALAQMFAGPRGAGTWVGVQNTLANFAGILGPVITGVIIDRTGSYISAFMVTAAVGLFGAIWWSLALPPVEQIDLDNPEALER